MFHDALNVNRGCRPLSDEQQPSGRGSGSVRIYTMLAPISSRLVRHFEHWCVWTKTDVHEIRTRAVRI
jgi:hypothetical protein